MTPGEQLVEERRRFHRIGLDREVHVRPTAASDDSAGGRCRLVDISLRGLLLESCVGLTVRLGEKLAVAVMLDDEGASRIRLHGKVAHLEAGQIGVRVLDMDLDSASLLRRLVEVNLDDEALLDRELHAMILKTAGGRLPGRVPRGG